jgi:hypothetical protein
LDIVKELVRSPLRCLADARGLTAPPSTQLNYTPDQVTVDEA